MATGVLVLGCGHGTRLLHYLTLDDKRYRATLRLGRGTDSLDADGQVIAEAPVPRGLSLARVSALAGGFVGHQLQRAPVLSAIKRDGEPLHRRVRRGEAVEAPLRDVVVHELRVLGLDGSEVEFEVACGKGFYVRSLGRDLATALGTHGHLVALRRVASGPFGEDEAVDHGLLMQARQDGAARAKLIERLLPPLAALRGMPQVRVNREAEADLRHGRLAEIEQVARVEAEALEALSASSPIFGAAAAVSPDGQLIAIVEQRGEQLAVLRGFPP